MVTHACNPSTWDAEAGILLEYLDFLFYFPFPTAGVFCAIVSHPADSVVSVLNKEKGSTASQVLQRLGFRGKLGSPGTWHCLGRWRWFVRSPFFSEPGVWKGLFARIIMIGTLTALQWFIYDSVKVYFRLPRPPPPEMPESLKKKLGLTE